MIAGPKPEQTNIDFDGQSVESACRDIAIELLIPFISVEREGSISECRELIRW